MLIDIRLQATQQERSFRPAAAMFIKGADEQRHSEKVKKPMILVK